MNSENFLFAFGLTVFAGLSTGIGSAMAFLSKNFNPKFLAGSLGFSAGVMIYVSLIEIFPKAKDSLTLLYGYKQGYWLTVIAFFGGILGMAIITLMLYSSVIEKRENFALLKAIGASHKYLIFLWSWNLMNNWDMLTQENYKKL